MLRTVKSSKKHSINHNLAARVQPTATNMVHAKSFPCWTETRAAVLHKWYLLESNKCRSGLMQTMMHVIESSPLSRLKGGLRALLRATAYMLSAHMLSQFRPSVRLSVCPSHGWISQKRLKLGSCNFHHTVTPSL